MKKQTLVAGLAVAALGLGTTAWAGYKLTSPVNVLPSARFAFGTLGSARNSADTRQFIGVSTMVTLGGETMTAYAEDASGNYVTCNSSRASFIAAARALKSDSYVYFAWDALGECTQLMVDTSSYFEPKAP
ncbi:MULTISPECIES: hypothetical protein [unclassified Corallococcus]|uniref:hypothetical protein n=1 Tax=unclassified Corallococcus TaxID=2685029 RepID=UPI001A8D3179|nr:MULTISPECIES: hypothetical protein [unclassified Corallococcus]MBN9685606.1 hypothetical protein [Corallococcus sp. NCSPR001]WAS82949.1 hypothetical protein O0N60_26920 [Corallococcus sp. NCRR]